MKIAVHDPATGRIVSVLGFPASAVTDAFDNIPEGMGAVEVGEGVRPNTHYLDLDDNLRLVEYPERPGDWAEFDFSTKQWIDPRPPEEPKDPAVVLQEHRQGAVARINRAAGAVRRLYITDIPGQEALYLMKEAEARAWLAETVPDPANHPLIAAEIGITAPSGDEVAQVYLNLAAIYVQAAAQLEHARLGHIAMAEIASTSEAADAVADAFEALLQAL